MARNHYLLPCSSCNTFSPDGKTCVSGGRIDLVEMDSNQTCAAGFIGCNCAMRLRLPAIGRFPQRLKPRELRSPCGTAEAVPFQNTTSYWAWMVFTPGFSGRVLPLTIKLPVRVPGRVMVALRPAPWRRY